jgi:hypothetical protein
MASSPSPAHRRLSCRLGLHGRSARQHGVRNGSVEFAECPHCARTFIRHDSGDWQRVPAGYRVVWKSVSTGDS